MKKFSRYILAFLMVVSLTLAGGLVLKDKAPDVAKAAAITEPTAVGGLVYDGTPQTGVNVDYTDYEFDSGDPIVQTDAGNYISYFNLLNPGSDTWDIQGDNLTLEVVWSIAPKPVTVTPDAGQSKVFGALEPTFTYVLGETIGTTGVIGRAAGESVAGGPYAYTIGTLAPTSSNYTLTLSGTATFAITAKPVTVTPDAGQSKVFGAADPTFTYVLGETITTTGALGRAAGESVAGGPYAYTIGTLAPSSSNYTLTLSGTATFAITAKPVTVTPNVGQSKVYGETDPTFTYVLGEAIGTTGVIGREAGESVAGGPYAYTIGTLAPSSSNYTLTLSGAATFAITPRPISIKADDKTKVYGDAVPTLTWTLTSGTYATGESAANITGSLACTAAANTPVASSPVSITQGTVGNANYDITFTNGSLTITPKSITMLDITPNAQNKDYDTNTDASFNPEFTLGTILFGDEVGVDLSGSFADKFAGVNKAVTVTGWVLTGADAGNYVLVPAVPVGFTDIATIFPRTIEITVDPGDFYVTKVYDGTTSKGAGIGSENFAIHIIYDGLDGKQEAAISIEVDQYSGNAVGTYTVRVWFVLAGNTSDYKLITYWLDVPAEITKAPISVQAGTYSVSKTYNGTAAAGTASGALYITGIIAADAATVEVTEAIGLFGSANAGTYTVNVTLGLNDDTNYYLVSNTVGVPGVINAKALANNMFAANVEKADYNYGAQEPGVYITGTDVNLTGLDFYIVSYGNNTFEGTATITIQGIRNYTGVAYATFEITDMLSRDKDFYTRLLNNYVDPQLYFEGQQKQLANYILDGTALIKAILLDWDYSAQDVIDAKADIEGIYEEYKLLIKGIITKAVFGDYDAKLEAWLGKGDIKDYAGNGGYLTFSEGEKEAIDAALVIFNNNLDAIKASITATIADIEDLFDNTDLLAAYRSAIIRDLNAWLGLDVSLQPTANGQLTAYTAAAIEAIYKYDGVEKEFSGIIGLAYAKVLSVTAYVGDVKPAEVTKDILDVAKDAVTDVYADEALVLQGVQDIIDSFEKKVGDPAKALYEQADYTKAGWDKMLKAKADGIDAITEAMKISAANFAKFGVIGENYTFNRAAYNNLVTDMKDDIADIKDRAELEEEVDLYVKDAIDELFTWFNETILVEGKYSASQLAKIKADFYAGIEEILACIEDEGKRADVREAVIYENFEAKYAAYLNALDSTKYFSDDWTAISNKINAALDEIYDEDTALEDIEGILAELKAYIDGVAKLKDVVNGWLAEIEADYKDERAAALVTGIKATLNGYTNATTKVAATAAYETFKTDYAAKVALENAREKAYDDLFDIIANVLTELEVEENDVVTMIISDVVNGYLNQIKVAATKAAVEAILADEPALIEEDPAITVASKIKTAITANINIYKAVLALNSESTEPEIEAAIKALATVLDGKVNAFADYNLFKLALAGIDAPEADDVTAAKGVLSTALQAIISAYDDEVYSDITALVAKFLEVFEPAPAPVAPVSDIVLLGDFGANGVYNDGKVEDLEDLLVLLTEKVDGFDLEITDFDAYNKTEGDKFITWLGTKGIIIKDSEEDPVTLGLLDKIVNALADAADNAAVDEVIKMSESLVEARIIFLLLGIDANDESFTYDFSDTLEGLAEKTDAIVDFWSGIPAGQKNLSAVKEAVKDVISDVLNSDPDPVKGYQDIIDAAVAEGTDTIGKAIYFAETLLGNPIAGDLTTAQVNAILDIIKDAKLKTYFTLVFNDDADPDSLTVKYSAVEDILADAVNKILGSTDETKYAGFIAKAKTDITDKVDFALGIINGFEIVITDITADEVAEIIKLYDNDTVILAKSRSLNINTELKAAVTAILDSNPTTTAINNIAMAIAKDALTKEYASVVAGLGFDPAFDLADLKQAQADGIVKILKAIAGVAESHTKYAAIQAAAKAAVGDILKLSDPDGVPANAESAVEVNAIVDPKLATIKTLKLVGAVDDIKDGITGGITGLYPTQAYITEQANKFKAEKELLKNLYYADKWTTIQGRIDAIYAEILAADTYPEILAAIAKFNVDGVETKAEKDAKDLKAAQDDYLGKLKAEYEKFDSKKYSKKNYDKITQIYKDAETAIKAAGTPDAVKSIYEKAVNDMKAVKTQSFVWLWILIGAVVLVAAAVLIYIFLIRKKKTANAK